MMIRQGKIRSLASDHSVSGSGSLARACQGLLAVVLLGTLPGCPEKDDDDEVKPATSAPAVAVTPTPVASTTVAPEQPTAKIEPRVKAEVDNRPDGITGTPVAVTGATASLQAPTGWQTAKAEFTTSTAPDQKAQIAVGNFAAAEGPTAKLPNAATALGLTNCTWNPPEPVTLGKTKLAATAADGMCTKGAAPVKAAYVAPTAEGLLVVGQWAEGGDATNMFGAMRSVAKATGGGDPSGIAACCAALSQNSKSAPPEQQLAYGAAIAACNAAKNDPNGRAALSAVRAALGGAGAPASCK
jgi:hypothetical protein